MQKKKLISCKNLNEALKICQQNNIKVYPISLDFNWYVQVDINGKLKTINKIIGKGSVLDSKKPIYNGVSWVQAIDKTIIYYAEQILDINSKK